MGKKGPGKAAFIAAAAVALIAFLAYLPSLGNGFVNWDDDLYVYENPSIQAFDLHLLKWAFSGFHAGNWHPLTWLSLALDQAVGGQGPFWPHLTNNLLHALNALLVVLLVVRLLGLRRAPDILSEPRAAVTAGVLSGLLFSLHPLRVESVAWVSERKDLLCGFFFLLSLVCYAAFIERNRQEQPDRPTFRNRAFLATSLFFLLALMSKPMAVTLPVVLLILDWYPGSRISSGSELRAAVIEKMPLFALSLLSAFITVLAQRSGSAIVPFEIMPLADRLLVASQSVVSYLLKTAVPLHLLPFYAYPRGISLWSSLPALGAVLGMTAASIALVRTYKLAAAVWLTYLVMLAPVLGIIQVGGQAMADRYTYLPTLPFFMAAGCGLTLLFVLAGRARTNPVLLRAAAAVPAIVIVVALAGLTLRQQTVWRNSVSLWSYLIDDERQELVLAYYNRGLAYGKDNNQLDLSIADFTRAVSLNPGFSIAYNNRGVAYLLEQQLDPAARDFTRAIELNNSYAEAYINRALVALRRGAVSAAIVDLRRGCELGNSAGCQALEQVLRSSAQGK